MGLTINLDKLIKRQVVESERIEFKRGWNPEGILHSICAFANDFNNWGGGYIIIGIHEIDGVPQLPPIGIQINQLDTIQKKLIEICNRISPAYTPIISPEVYQKKNVVAIQIPGGEARPYKASRTWNTPQVYWIRKGSKTVVANKQDEIRLMEQANKIPFDDRKNLQVELENLSFPIIQSFLREIKSGLYLQSGSIPFEDLCRQMNIIRGAKEEPYIINVGLLMFSEEPHKIFNGCKTEIIIYKDDVGDDFEESIFTGPIHIQIRNVLNFVKSSIIRVKTIKVPGQAESIRTFNYPYNALEESIANAYYHRSYEDQRTIEINVRINEVEIVSYPGPLPPINNIELKKPRVVARDYRNRRIGDFLKELKLTEGRGTGFPKIRRSMKLNGSPDPIFETDDELSYFIVKLPINPIFRELDLTDYGRSILEFCKTPQKRKVILEHLGLKSLNENAKRHLSPLVNSGYLQYLYPEVPQSPKQRYTITEKGLEALKR